MPVIKTISHHSTKESRMQALVDYIFDRTKIHDQERGRKPVMVKQFLRSYNTKGYGRQFKENDSKRTYDYGKRRTTLRHEIISFNKNSDEHLTESVLQRIATHYLKTRCPKSLAVASVHYDENPHIHVVWSAVNISGSPTRIKQKEFAEFKRDFQQWQERKFPELHHSLVEHGKKKPCRFALLKKKNT